MRCCACWVVVLFFTAALQAAEPPTPTQVKQPELQAELLRRVKTDQDARAALMRWRKQNGPTKINDQAPLEPAQKAEFTRLSDTLRRVDAENTARLGEIVEQFGWPTVTLVGKDGASAAWLLVQHADASPQFQRKCLDLMVGLPPTEVSPKDVAYLTDRVLLAEGKKQVYGTQVAMTEGKFQPRALEDEANVDRRRAEVGLPPLAEYLKQVESFYGRERDE